MKAISGKRLCRLLQARGWRLARVRGSHHIFVKPGTNVRISVPVHGMAVGGSSTRTHSAPGWSVRWATPFVRMITFAPPETPIRPGWLTLRRAPYPNDAGPQRDQAPRPMR